MMKSNSRVIIFGEMFLKYFAHISEQETEISKNTSMPGLSFLLDKTCELVNTHKDNCAWDTRNEDKQIYIHKITKVPDKASFAYIILFDCMLGNKADQAMRNKVTKQRKVPLKAPGDQADFSSHCIIRINSNDFTAKVLLEESNGMSMTSIAQMFRHIFAKVKKNNSSDFQIDDLSGIKKNNKPKKCAIRVQCHLKTIADKQFAQDFLNGRRYNVTYFIPAKLQNFDTAPGFTYEIVNVPVSLTQEFGANLRDIHKIYKPIITNKKIKAKLGFLDSENRQHSILIDSSGLKKSMKSYTKSATIKLKDRATSVDDIDAEIVDAMLKLN